MSDRSKYGEAHGYHGKPCSGMHFNVEGVSGVFLAYEDYDLLREAAEKWARHVVWEADDAWCCEVFRHDMELHAADCKAARILGLKREP